jgi:hypothetical protein
MDMLRVLSFLIKGLNKALKIKKKKKKNIVGFR